MKKFFALVLALAVVLSLGVTAFAGSSGGGSSSGSTVDLGWGEFTTATAPAAAKTTAQIYGKDGKEIAEIDESSVVILPVGEADKLSEADKEAFLAAYEEAKAVEGKVVKYFYWIDIPEEFKTDDFSWFRFDFKCAGENVEVTVNGNPMEVVHVDGVDYYAKLTEFGAVAIMCD